MSTEDILTQIDHVIEDYSVGPDAMRWTPEEQPEVKPRKAIWSDDIWSHYRRQLQARMQARMAERTDEDILLAQGAILASGPNDEEFTLVTLSPGTVEWLYRDNFEAFAGTAARVSSRVNEILAEANNDFDPLGSTEELSGLERLRQVNDQIEADLDAQSEETLP